MFAVSAPSSDRVHEVPKQMTMPKGRHYRLFAVLPSIAFDNDNLKYVSWKGPDGGFLFIIREHWKSFNRESAACKAMV